MSKEIMSIILAAGKSTTMNSNIPKAIHTFCGKPMASWILQAAFGAGINNSVMVVAPDADDIRSRFEGLVEFAVQPEPKGTGDAVMCARKCLESHKGLVVVLPADTPLIDSDTLKQAIEYHDEFKNKATIITAFVKNPLGYGRILRNSAGDVVGIVEHDDASILELEIKEINSSMYIFDCEALCYALDNLDSVNDNFDRYNLIHTLDVLIKSGRKVGAYDADDANCILGINDYIQMQEVEKIMYSKIVEQHMKNGVRFIAPETAYIEHDVAIGVDTIVQPNVQVTGGSVIGKNVVVGANSIIKNSKIDDGVVIQSSVITDSEVGDNSTIGPFAYLRPNSKIGKHVKIGDFVEIKNATLDDDTKVSHLTYVGDADIGKGVNFGCGCVTVNYDGKKKFRTSVGDGAFIGCNTNLVAPVKINNGAYIAAGSTITDEVPEESLAIARSRQVNKLGWKNKGDSNK